MNELPFDPKQLADLLGISPDDATQLMKAAEADMQERAAAVLAANPNAVSISDAERVAIQAQAEKEGIPFEQLLERTIRGRAWMSDLLGNLRRRGTKVSRSGVTECLGNDLPKGWDDMVSKE